MEGYDGLMLFYRIRLVKWINFKGLCVDMSIILIAKF